MSSQSSDLADDIVPSAVPEHAVPLRVEFLPWHRVRKQYIRERQWNKLTSRMVDRYLRSQLQNDAADWSVAEEQGEAAETAAEVPESVRVDRPLRCLVIPGNDLLDMRALWRDLLPHNCFIQYLGFNEVQGSNQSGTRVHVANNEVTSLARVARDSVVLADRFQSIASERTQAYHYLRRYGPFHLVNLDLCDSLFPTTSRNPAEYFNALHRLTEYQMRHQTTPWLLFITTQVEPGVVDAPELQKLCTPIRQNHDKHPQFATELERLVPKDAFQTQDAAIELSDLDEGATVRLFGVALGKYLLSLGTSAHPNWAVHMLPSYRYWINRKPHVEMLSLAFQFRRKFSPPVDHTGLSSLEMDPPKFPDELECARKLVIAVENIRDLDALLQSDDDLRVEMENSSADLLEAAGYDREAYLTWVRSGEGSAEVAMND